MFLGLDLGTSSLKALLVDGAQRVVAGAAVPLTVQRPAPGRSERARFSHTRIGAGGPGARLFVLDVAADRLPPGATPRAAVSADITALNAPTPGTSRPSASRARVRSEVSSTSAPASSSALTAEWTLPEP